MVTIEGKKYLELSDAAEVLKVTRARVQQFVAAGEFAGAVQLSECSAWLIPAADVRVFARIPRSKPGRPKALAITP